MGTRHGLFARSARRDQHPVLAGRTRAPPEPADDQCVGALRWPVGRRLRAHRFAPATAPGERRTVWVRRWDLRRCAARRLSAIRRSRFDVSGTELDLDWAVHVFGGLNRRPTFVPQFTPDAQLASVDAVYTEILQIGGEVETTRADWRFLSEGFWRRGGLDVTGQERTYGCAHRGRRISTTRRVRRRLQFYSPPRHHGRHPWGPG